MIRLSGKEPDRDIPIEFIGVRPGEKLHEELWGVGEDAVPTAHTKILRCASAPVDPAWLDDELAELERLVEAGETLDLVAKLGELVRAPRRLGAQTAEPV
jgi:FlaA1/EpsC-like NDP-sugar epimerase